MKKALEPASSGAFAFWILFQMVSDSLRSLPLVSIGARYVPPFTPFKHFRIIAGNRGQPFLYLMRTRSKMEHRPAGTDMHLN